MVYGIKLVAKSLESGLPPDLQLCHLPDVWAEQVTEAYHAHQRNGRKMGKAKEG